VTEPADLSTDPVRQRSVSTDRSDSDDADVVEPAGHFRVYLGAAPGVGKTFAMLDEGHRRLERGADVVIGFIESHGRRHTEERIGALEIVPRKIVRYRDTEFEEMDVDAILARRPKLALIDELAHTNAPGFGQNEKRWQDILEILEAGIDVISTVNIQHLESTANVVEQITGIKVRERVPDWFLRTADQIELVDSSPEQLRRRMLHGNIYPQEKINQALTQFFRSENLTALRELSLRFLADETDEEILQHLRKHQHSAVWETAERIMVVVTDEPGTDVMVHRAARIASRIKAPLDVFHVTSGEAVASSTKFCKRLRELAKEFGADWHVVQADDAATAIMEFARREQITQIVLGSTPTTRWQQLFGSGAVVRRVQKMAASSTIDVHIIALSVTPEEIEQ
jgi:two-component system sensor histidine kinase KdpD